MVEAHAAVRWHGLIQSPQVLQRRGAAVLDEGSHLKQPGRPLDEAQLHVEGARKSSTQNAGQEAAKVGGDGAEPLAIVPREDRTAEDHTAQLHSPPGPGYFLLALPRPRDQLPPPL